MKSAFLFNILHYGQETCIVCVYVIGQNFHNIRMYVSYSEHLYLLPMQQFIPNITHSNSRRRRAPISVAKVFTI